MESPVHPVPPVDFAHLPWQDGETLTYRVAWGPIEAAEGVFVASKKSGRWEFKLSLASRGPVNEIYPFTGQFWSILGKGPWRSVEYGEYRFEPQRTIKERTRVDYVKQLATREIWSKGETKAFPLAGQDLDDVGSMLYHIRATAWKPGDQRTLFVYESNAIKQADVSWQGRETRAFGLWPAQPLIRIQALPGKGTRRRGGLVMWMTDDARRLPLHSELDFRYGSFTIDLISANPPLSTKP